MSRSRVLVLFAFAAICSAKSSSNVSQNPAQDLLTTERTRTWSDFDRLSDGNWTTLTEALDVFNVRHLASNWTEGRYPVAEQCAKDLTRYIRGLKRHEGWALKGKFEFIRLYKLSFFCFVDAELTFAY